MGTNVQISACVNVCVYDYNIFLFQPSHTTFIGLGKREKSTSRNAYIPTLPIATAIAWSLKATN